MKIPFYSKTICYKKVTINEGRFVAEIITDIMRISEENNIINIKYI
jgi:hypothetical protein